MFSQLVRTSGLRNGATKPLIPRIPIILSQFPLTTACVSSRFHCCSIHVASTAAKYIGVYAALGVGASTAIAVASVFSTTAGNRASRFVPLDSVLLSDGSFGRNLHNRMLSAVLHSPMSFFDTTPLGRIVNRFAKDMYTVDETIPSSSRSFVTTALSVCCTIVRRLSVKFHLFQGTFDHCGYLHFHAAFPGCSHSLRCLLLLRSKVLWFVSLILCEAFMAN